MGSPPVELDPHALRPLRPTGRGLALACAAISMVAAAVHAIRDGQPAWAALLAGAAGLTIAIWWWPTPAPRLTGCRWDEAGWHGTFDDDPQPCSVRVTGVVVTQGHLLLRIEARRPTGGRWDELFLVDGDRLGDARWSRLRSTLRLAMPDKAPLA